MSYISPHLVTPSTGTPPPFILNPSFSEHKPCGDLRPQVSGALPEPRPFTGHEPPLPAGPFRRLRWTFPIFAFFFSSSHSEILFSLSWVFLVGFLVFWAVLKRKGPTKHALVRSSGHLVKNKAAPPDGAAGARTRWPENSACAC